MPTLIKSFQKEGMTVAITKVSKEDKLLLSGDGNHRGGYMVSCGDSNENRIRLIFAKSFKSNPARWQIDAVIKSAIVSRDKMDAKDGVSETLNMLQELGFKPTSDF